MQSKKNLDLNNKNYVKNIIRFSTKKGKKELSEKNLRKSFYYHTKSNNNMKFIDCIKSAVKKTSICFGVKTKRKGSKNINVPVYLHKKKQLFLVYKLLLENLDKKNYNETKYYKRLILSMVNTIENKSSAIKKKTEIYKIIEESINL